jgi:HAD superfamily hydrolase (TIGR01509 family)
MTIKAVIFDLDGTITKPFFDFDAIRREMGLSEKSGPILEAMQEMNPQQRREAEKILHSHEQQAVQQSSINNGSRKTLEALRSGGIRIGILTRNTRNNALAIEKKHKLKFDAIVDREDGPVKPDAFGVLRICQQFGITPQQTVVVGDYLFDLLCAKAAGAAAVLIKNHKDAEQFAKHADFVIDSLEQILPIIKEKNENEPGPSKE